MNLEVDLPKTDTRCRSKQLAGDFLDARDDKAIPYRTGAPCPRPVLTPGGVPSMR